VTVLDASALLTYLRKEAGADVVERALAEDAVIGALSLAEVLSKLTDSGRLRPLTAKAGLSLGDRASLALGLRLGRRVLTANAAWPRLVP
jgi:ribonuclease VapC